MKHLCTLIIIFYIVSTAYSQTPKDAVVEVSAIVDANKPSISLQWQFSDNATQYQIYRKAKNATSWGNARATLSSPVSSWEDTTVAVGIEYEYRVVSSGSIISYGYVLSGIEIHPVHFRGTMILCIEKTISDSLPNLVSTTISDLEGDGWHVQVVATDRSETAASVKTKIVNAFNEFPNSTKALYLLGNVPVPYSGNIYPDGHPDHQGAWPADCYYGDINGLWTDAGVNNSIANDERNKNIPGDGKFDQNTIPSDVELQVGRVDLSNLPDFATSEVGLLAKYLEKAHRFKQKQLPINKKAIIDDNFGYFGGESFASNGWRNFAPLLGAGNVSVGDYLTTLAAENYIWSYGCGGGSYTSAGGIGNTTIIANASLNGIFSMLFGSYFGDWDKTDNFLRAPLASGNVLTNAWAGRPHWYFHHMGLGENIGYSTKVTQNNNSTYFASYGGRFVHIALMGDPSLRQDIVAPPSLLTANNNEYDVNLHWQSSADSIIGYYVYYRQAGNASFQLLNEDPITETSFTHTCIDSIGLTEYMVRATKLETTNSGSYFNLSQGVMTQIDIKEVTPAVAAQATFTIDDANVVFANQSIGANTYLWDFGDGTFSDVASPTKKFTSGSHVVTLIANGPCKSDTLHLIIDILSSINDEKVPQLSLQPNPVDDILQVIHPENISKSNGYSIFNTTGQKVASGLIDDNMINIKVATLIPGMYSFIVYYADGTMWAATFAKQ